MYYFSLIIFQLQFNDGLHPCCSKYWPFLYTTTTIWSIRPPPCPPPLHRCPVAGCCGYVILLVSILDSPRSITIGSKTADRSIYVACRQSSKHQCGIRRLTYRIPPGASEIRLCQCSMGQALLKPLMTPLTSSIDSSNTHLQSSRAYINAYGSWHYVPPLPTSLKF